MSRSGPTNNISQVPTGLYGRHFVLLVILDNFPLLQDNQFSYLRHRSSCMSLQRKESREEMHQYYHFIVSHGAREQSIQGMDRIFSYHFIFV